MKKTSTFQNGLIWFGAGVSLAEILTGTSFAPLGMAKGFAAILIGHIIGCAMMLLAGLIGGRTGRSAMETVKMSFGQKGGLLFAFLNVLQLVGWTAIMIYDGALAVGGIFDIGRWVWCLVIGALIILWIAVGITDLGWLNKLTMAALFVLTLVLCKVIFFSGNAMPDLTGESLTFGKIRMFTNFSHELRTPLMLILSPLEEVLQRVDMNPNLKGSLRLVYGNAQRLLLLVNQ